MTFAVSWSRLNTVVPPPTIPRNVIRAANWRGGSPRPLAVPANRRLTVSLLDPNEITVDVLGLTDDALLLHEGITDLTWERAGQALSVGRLAKTSRRIDENTYTISCTATDYRGLLDRRLLVPGTGYTLAPNGTRTATADLKITYLSGTPVENAMWDIIDNVQSQPGGDLGIRKGIWPATGATVPLGSGSSLQFTGDQTAWAALQTVMKTNGGFDLNIDVNRLANLYYPQRGGIDKGTVLDYGGAVASLGRDVDMGQYANVVREAGQQPASPAYVVPADIGKRPEGRWDMNFTDATLPSTGAPLVTPATVTQMANYNHANASRLLPAYQLTLAAGAWRGPSWLWVGDIVTVAINIGDLKVHDKLRVFGLSISVDQNDVETVAVDVGRPRSTVQKAWRQLSQQVSALNRR